MTTIEKAEKLVYYLRLHRREADPVIDNVLDKLLDRERQVLRKQRDELNTELAQFEQQYALSSTEFYEKFKHGEMGDGIDFVDWVGAWRVYQTVLESLAAFQTEPIAL